MPLLFQVDAFTNELFGGNPAAVVLLEQPLDDKLLLTVAQEMNQSETAYITQLPDHDDGGTFGTASHFGLRWFTPGMEVPLCGHATLASAAALFIEMVNPGKTLHFHTLSGVLSVSDVTPQSPRARASRARTLQMSLPLFLSDAPLPGPIDDPTSAATRQFVTACAGSAQVVDRAFAPALRYVVLRLADSITREQFEAIKPDFAAMQAAVPGDVVRGVILTCKGDGQPYDFLSRFFCPWMGGPPEDPVTGSAHSVLGPYWSQHLDGKGTQAGAASGLTKDPADVVQPLLARQCSQRGGELQVVVQHNTGRVLLSGSAIVVSRGALMLPPVGGEAY